MSNPSNSQDIVGRTRAILGDKYAERLELVLPVYQRNPVLFFRFHPMLGQHFWRVYEEHDDVAVRLAAEREIWGLPSPVPDHLLAPVMEHVNKIRRDALDVSDDLIFQRRYLKHFGDLGLYIVPDEIQIERNYSDLIQRTANARVRIET